MLLLCGPSDNRPAIILLRDWQRYDAEFNLRVRVPLAFATFGCSCAQATEAMRRFVEVMGELYFAVPWWRRVAWRAAYYLENAVRFLREV